MAVIGPSTERVKKENIIKLVSWVMVSIMVFTNGTCILHNPHKALSNFGH